MYKTPPGGGEGGLLPAQGLFEQLGPDVQGDCCCIIYSNDFDYQAFDLMRYQLENIGTSARIVFSGWHHIISSALVVNNSIICNFPFCKTKQ